MSELPQGWVEVRVGDVAASLIDGPFGSNLKTEHYTAEGARVIRLQNIGDGRFVDTDKTFIAEDRYQLLRRHDAQPGDILIAALGAVLPRVCMVPPQLGAAIVKADCFRLRSNSLVDAKYLMFALQSPQMRAAAAPQIAGVGRPRLNLGKVRNLPLALAPAAEQKRIVAAIDEAFSRIDAGEAGLQRVRRHLGFLRGAVLKALTNPADEWVKLGEIAEVVGGVTKDIKRQADPSYVEVPYLRVANVQRGYLDLGVVTTIRVPASTVEKLRLEPDDILFNEGGDRDKLGRGWVWEGQVPDCIHQNHVFRARLRTDEFDPKFVSMHGNTFGRTWFETMGKQTTNLASVSLTTLKAFPIPKVPIDEQRRLVTQVEAQTSQIVAFERIVELAQRRAAALRSAILSSAFDGHLVSQNPGDESSAILLDRIASERGSSNSHDKATGTRWARTARQEVTA